MSSSITAAVASRAGRFLPSRRRLVRRVVAVLTGAMILGAAAWWSLEGSRGGDQAEARGARPAPEVAIVTRATPPAGQAETVRIDEERQRAIGLKTARVVPGVSFDVLTAPGLVAPNEAQYAYITPRAAGVVRSVTAHVGQDVKAGDLLATIDSPEVGEVRLELYTRLQALEIARAQADWQQTIYRNTLELIEHLQKGETPEQIHEAFAERPVGENRERLMTAYAQYRLAVATIEREPRPLRAETDHPQAVREGQRRLRGGPGHLPEPDGPDGLRGPAGEHPRPAGPEAGRDGGAGGSGTAPDPGRQARRHRARGRARQGRRRQARRDAPRAGPVGEHRFGEAGDDPPVREAEEQPRRRSRSGPCLATSRSPTTARSAPTRSGPRSTARSSTAR